MELIVDKDITLLDFLNTNISDKSKNNIKSLLSKKLTYVNNKLVSKHDYQLHHSDRVHIIDKYIKFNDNIIEILYEDKELIAVNKPHHLLTIGTNKERVNTLYNLVSSYVKKRNRNNKIFIVHRLDKDTSGVVLFAKNEKIKNILQEKWNNLAIKREYLCMTHGIINKTLKLENYLSEDKFNNTYISNKAHGKLAITEIEVLEKYKDKSLLKVLIKTGRKNQIRVQLANINHPIIGDKKYGIKDNSKVMLLHASKLEIVNPLNNKIIIINTIFPQEFVK